MKRVLPDLWQTRTHRPFAGATTRAYLWTGASGTGNVLFYSPGTEDDFDDLHRLGGIADQYLSHVDEAGPMLARISERFGARLHAPAAESAEIGRFSAIDVPLAERHIDERGVEVVPAPGHTAGSTCYLVSGVGGDRYLFTGDTLYVGRDGGWQAGYIPGHSEAEPLASSLRLMARLAPDVVVSSAYTGDTGVHRIDPADWPGIIDDALAGLAAAVG